MGCGCGTNKTNEQAPKTRLARAKESIRNVWEKAQIDQPMHTVKRINKK